MDGRLGESAEASPRSRLVPGEAGAAGAGARGHAGHQLLHRQLRAQGQRPGGQVARGTVILCVLHVIDNIPQQLFLQKGGDHQIVDVPLSRL